MVDQKDKIVVRLARDNADHLVPAHFYDILMHRFFPVLSLTYISSVVGIAAKQDSFLHYMFADRKAYLMALFVVLWVAVPGVIWIFLKGNPVQTYVADIWYKILAGIMVVTLMLSFVLFPEADIFGLRLYFVASIPAFIMMYFFFVKSGLPPLAAHPLNMAGLGMLVYGAILNLFLG
ncbi:MAG: hypothetical protein KDI13_02240 [Alphaproteobacteria bacterium]|nr:hypothetical protein [Alphaproteobacteria bacterium]